MIVYLNLLILYRSCYPNSKIVYYDNTRTDVHIPQSIDIH